MAQAPPPAQGLRFALPLADGSTAEAMFLPTPGTATQIVYATTSGKLGLWPTTTPPNPEPTPAPKPPPTPDVPSVVVTISATEAETLPAEIAAYIAANGGSYSGFTVAMVATEKPPPDALKWIGRAAGKNLPYSFIATREGKIIVEGPTPASAAAWLQFWENKTTRAASPPASTCPNCKQLQKRGILLLRKNP